MIRPISPKKITWKNGEKAKRGGGKIILNMIESIYAGNAQKLWLFMEESVFAVVNLDMNFYRLITSSEGALSTAKN